MKKISIVIPTFNEELNIKEFYYEIKKQISVYNQYIFEIIIIDNASVDNTIQILKEIASNDKIVKLIINTRNFGHIRSPYWGILNGAGDAVIYMASDFQDPPELIHDFISAWENGWYVVYGVKPNSKTNFIIHKIRTIFYKFLNFICEHEVVENATGFGLYDKKIIKLLKDINDPFPFLRGLVSELGYPIKKINYLQNKRRFGSSKNNFYDLYEFGLFSIVSQSTLPIRIISIIGFLSSIISICALIIYIFLKLVYWYEYPAGIIPVICLITFFFSVLLTTLGILGEYQLLMLKHIRKRPIVIESERINF